jgi:hypothetical protein
MGDKSSEKQLAAFIAKYAPEVAALAGEVLEKMRSRLPGAVEMVYDNYNWLVVGFGPTERPSDAIFSVVLAPRWVSLCFLWGAKLPDPDRLLKGSGKQVRNIRLDDAAVLDRPAIQALMAHALERGEPIDPASPRRLIIKSISAKQRPRRPKS